MASFFADAREELAKLAEHDEEAAAIEPVGGVLEHVFAVQDADAFERVPAPAVLRRWLIVATNRTPVGGASRREIIGEVLEGPSAAHVVFRERALADANVSRELQPPDSVRVISVRRVAGSWRVDLGGGLIFHEGGGWSIGYDPGAIDPTEGEEEFLASLR